MIEDDTPYDLWLIKNSVLVAGLIVVVVVVITGAILWVKWSVETNEAEEECLNNPRLLYGRPCDSYEDCLSACIEEVKDGS